MVRKIDQVCHYCCCFYSFGGCLVPFSSRYQYLLICGSHGLLHRYQYSRPPWGNERRASFSSDDASWMLNLMGVDPYWSSFSWTILSMAMGRVVVSSRKQRKRWTHSPLRSLMVLMAPLWGFRARSQWNDMGGWVDCQLTGPLVASILAQTSWVLSLEARGGACRHLQSLS